MNISKKIVLVIFCTWAWQSSIAQSEVPEDNSLVPSTIQNVRDAEDLKSGNSKDVLYSFFQLAARDFTGNEKSFAFNSTLFAIKLRADPSLLQAEKIVKHNFARNFQFNFKANLDSSYKFKGLSGGFTYALVNGRDRQLAKFNKGYIQEKLNIDGIATIYFNRLQAFTASITKKIIDDPKLASTEKETLLADLSTGIDYLNETGKLDKIPPRFLTDLTGGDTERQTIDSLRQQILARRDTALQLIDKKWFWTISAIGTTNKLNTFDRGVLNTVILKGSNPELDVRSSLSYSDTLVVTKFSQVKLASSIGLNFPLLKSDQGNLCELKAYMEYNKILKNPLSTDEKEKFLANADLRVRITDKLWLPLTIKYDIENDNFLGFLNLSFNIDAFK